jgi:hypothetical protein
MRIGRDGLGEHENSRVLAPPPQTTHIACHANAWWGRTGVAEPTAGEPPGRRGGDEPVAGEPPGEQGRTSFGGKEGTSGGRSCSDGEDKGTIDGEGRTSFGDEGTSDGRSSSDSEEMRTGSEEGVELDGAGDADDAVSSNCWIHAAVGELWEASHGCGYKCVGPGAKIGPISTSAPGAYWRKS